MNSVKSARVGVVILLLSGTSCSSGMKVGDVFEHCIREWEVKYGLRQLEPDADKNAKAEKIPVTSTVLIEKTCHRQIYERSGQRITFVSTTNDPETSVRVTMGGMGRGARTKECLDRGVQSVLELGRPDLKNVLEEHHRRYGALWDDLEAGPVKWLVCNAKNDLEWTAGLQTFVHEMNHENALGSCVYFPREGRRLCFDFSEAMPDFELAKLKGALPNVNADTQKLNDLDELYLTPGRSLRSMLDEVVSYTLELRLLTARQKKDGDAAVFSKRWHSRIQLPTMMLFVAHYMVRFREKDPKLFAKNLDEGSENRKNFARIMAEGESAFRQWRAMIRARDGEFYEVERASWEGYLMFQSLLR